MEIVLQVQDPHKATKLLEYLRACDFVSDIQTSSIDEQKGIQENISEKADFFNGAGLWEKRDVTLDSLRRQAWRKCTV
ncbi:hypothetical protein [Desulfonatronum thioautotrophicum]|uniref:hypothetical protein n=1 Tax=Desulfonatronum thioautotrophicum TaxID=617001 RepID=UPI0005EBAB57|nr:hypothetical protein [Desulfonatronum thioautotrophicum]